MAVAGVLLFHVRVECGVAEVGLFAVVALVVALRRVVLGSAATSCHTVLRSLVALLTLLPLLRWVAVLHIVRIHLVGHLVLTH